MTTHKSLAHIPGTWHDVTAKFKDCTLTKEGWRAVLINVYVDGELFRDHMYVKVFKGLADLGPGRETHIGFKAQITYYIRRDGSKGLTFDRTRHFYRRWF